MTTVYKFKAGYTKVGIAAAPTAAPTITVVDSANNVLVNAVVATSLGNLVGAYLYSYTGVDGLDLIGLFHTTDATVDQQDLFSYTSDALTNGFNATGLAAIADALLDRIAGVETGHTVRQALRLMLSALVGKISGAGTTSVHIRDVNDAKDRIVATVDVNGNRSGVSEDAT